MRRPLLGIALAALGCGSGTGGRGDLAASPDLLQGPAEDLAAGDRAMPDLAAPDAATPDLGMPDLAMPDLRPPADLAMPDLAMPDLRPPADLATPPDLATGPDLARADGPPGCPKPPSMAGFDATNLTCDELLNGYLAAVAAAKPCGCAADCSAKACDTLCCNCEVFVNPGNDAYPRLKAIEKEFAQRVANWQCQPLVCPLFVCPEPTFGGCVADNNGRDACKTN